MDDEVRGATRDMKRAFNRQLLSPGYDWLGFWTSADDTSGTVVDDARGNDFNHLGNGTTRCDVLDSSASYAVIGDSIVVTRGAASASPVGTSVTWTGTVSGSGDGDVLVMEDTVVGGVGYSMMGIDGIIDNGDPALLSGGLHGLAVATYPWWTAQVTSNGGTNRTLTLALMQTPLSQISVNSEYDDSDVKFLLGNVFIRDKYEQLLIADRRHVNTLELDGGFTGLDYSGKPFIVDPQCKRNTIFYITPETMKIFRNADFDWIEMGGDVLHQRENKDAFFATMYHYGDLACVARNGNGVLKDVTD